MAYNLEWLLEAVEKGDRPKYLFFWGHRKSNSGELTASCFSQWWPAPFTVDGLRYPTAEHWMMAQKAVLFNDNDTFQKIIAAKSPAEAKALGRQVKGFDDARWRENRFDIVVRGSVHKFGQDPALRAFLLATGDRVLVEASPVDRIWGIGLTADSAKAPNTQQWNGLNLLGFALMEARDRLR